MLKEIFLLINMELVETAAELFNFDLDKLQLIVNGVSIPLVGTYDELWFPGKELCMVMEYKDTKNALFHNVKPKHKTTLADLKKLVGRAPTNFFWPFPDELSYHDGKAVYISEYGVYHLAMKCQLPIGEKFRDWLAEEVVPSIRRTGQYKLHKQIADQVEQLAIKDQKILELVDKVAVMTLKEETKHVFQLYKHRFIPKKYIFLRPQSRNLSHALRVVNLEVYELIINEASVPNFMNILNRLKGKLRDQNIFFTASNNKLTGAAVDVPEMVRELIQESLE
jgi:prophage antirepressor-like protein